MICRRCLTLQTGKLLILLTRRLLHCSCLQHRAVACQVLVLPGLSAGITTHCAVKVHTFQV